MIKKQKIEMTKASIIDWINKIRHSWTKRQVESIANQIYQQTTVSTNIIPFPHPRDAHAWVKDHVSTEESTLPLVICCKEEGYSIKAYIRMMKNYTRDVDPIDTTSAVLYTKGCDTSAKVDAQREFVINFMQEHDKLILDYAAKRAANPDHTPYQILGAIPQLNGVESMDSLVSID